MPKPRLQPGHPDHHTLTHPPHQKLTYFKMHKHNVGAAPARKAPPAQPHLSPYAAGHKLETHTHIHPDSMALAHVGGRTSGHVRGGGVCVCVISSYSTRRTNNTHTTKSVLFSELTG